MANDLGATGRAALSDHAEMRFTSMAEDLVKNKGAAVVSIGSHLPLNVQLAALRLNKKLDGLGKTVRLMDGVRIDFGGDSGLGQAGGANQLVGGAGMAGLRQHPGGRLSHVVQVYQAQAGMHGIRHRTVSSSAGRVPAGQRILHIGRGLQNCERQAALENRGLDPQLLPMVGHGLGLRVEDRMKDKVLNAGIPGGCQGRPLDAEFVRMDIRADVIDGLCAVQRQRQSSIGVGVVGVVADVRIADVDETNENVVGHSHSL